MVYSYNEGYIADNFIFKILDVNSAFETYTFVKKAKDIPLNAMFHQRERKHSIYYLIRMRRQYILSKSENYLANTRHLEGRDNLTIVLSKEYYVNYYFSKTLLLNEID